MLFGLVRQGVRCDGKQYYQLLLIIIGCLIQVGETKYILSSCTVLGTTYGHLDKVFDIFLCVGIWLHITTVKAFGGSNFF